jgi:hypothetical protein
VSQVWFQLRTFFGMLQEFGKIWSCYERAIWSQFLENVAVCHTFLQTFEINWLINWE